MKQPFSNFFKNLTNIDLFVKSKNKNIFWIIEIFMILEIFKIIEIFQKIDALCIFLLLSNKPFFHIWVKYTQIKPDL